MGAGRESGDPRAQARSRTYSSLTGRAAAQASAARTDRGSRRRAAALAVDPHRRQLGERPRVHDASVRRPGRAARGRAGPARAGTSLTVNGLPAQAQGQREAVPGPHLAAGPLGLRLGHPEPLAQQRLPGLLLGDVLLRADAASSTADTEARSCDSERPCIETTSAASRLWRGQPLRARPRQIARCSSTVVSRNPRGRPVSSLRCGSRSTSAQPMSCWSAPSTTSSNGSAAVEALVAPRPCELPRQPRVRQLADRQRAAVFAADQHPLDPTPGVAPEPELRRRRRIRPPPLRRRRRSSRRR